MGGAFSSEGDSGILGVGHGLCLPLFFLGTRPAPSDLLLCPQSCRLSSLGWDPDWERLDTLPACVGPAGVGLAFMVCSNWPRQVSRSELVWRVIKPSFQPQESHVTPSGSCQRALHFGRYYEHLP